MSLTYGFCLGPEDTLYDSAQFSKVFRALIGDGVCEYGTGFALTLGSGFNIFLGSGYALADGRWLKNDERYSMTLPVAGNISDRYDAVAVQVNYENRSAGLELLSGIDLESVRENPAIIRNEKIYSILLYLFHIRRGATTIRESDVTDLRDDESLCGRVTPVEGIAAKALEVYAFLTGGIDTEVARILGLADAAIKKGAAAVAELDVAIRQKTGTEIGDVLTSLQKPDPAAEWLLCDGSRVPPEYGALVNAIGPVLPYIWHEDERFHSFIYSGIPAAE